MNFLSRPNLDKIKTYATQTMPNQISLYFKSQKEKLEESAYYKKERDEIKESVKKNLENTIELISDPKNQDLAGQLTKNSLALTGVCFLSYGVLTLGYDAISYSGDKIVTVLEENHSKFNQRILDAQRSYDLARVSIPRKSFSTSKNVSRNKISQEVIDSLGKYGYLASTSDNLLNSQVARFSKECGGKSLEILDDLANEKGLDFNDLVAMIKVESNFITSALSSKGAGGLIQLLPGTASSYGLSSADRFDCEKNLQAGTSYLRDQLPHALNVSVDREHENFFIIWKGSYNAGPNALKPSMDCPGLLRFECEWDNPEHTIPNTGYAETRAYGKKILKYSKLFSDSQKRFKFPSS